MAATRDSAFIATFLIVLPDVLPVPHGSTWTRQLEEPEPLLDGVQIRPLQHLETVEPVAQERGHNFASLKFLQVRDEQAATSEFLYRSVLAAKVAKALNPDGVGDPDHLLQTSLPEDDEPFRTVVEAGTFVAQESELSERDGKPDPLSRCIDVLLDFHRSYRVRANKHVPELTYETLHPAVLWFRRAAFDVEALPVPAGMVVLGNRNFAVPESKSLSQEMQRDILEFSVRLAAGDPFALYAERRLEAEREVWTTGRMGESVLQSSIAAEVFFDALLGLMLWEEHEAGSVNLEQAAGVFSSDITPRLRREYAKRLGGNWSLLQEPMRSWFTAIAGVRNRVVHAGYRPDKHAAADAYEALIAVEGFVGNQLANRWRKYPKTSWLFLGTSGFERRGKLTAAHAWLDESDGSTASWVREYQEWREQVSALVARRRQDRGGG